MIRWFCESCDLRQNQHRRWPTGTHQPNSGASRIRQTNGLARRGRIHDQISGRKADRPQLKKALEAGRRRKYDVLLFWSLDRLSRQGVLPTLLLLNQLTQYGVKYVSLQEQWINSLGAFSEAIIGVISAVAKFEADRMSSRVRTGLERARAQGKTLGRPRSIVDRGKLAAMRNKGMSLREIAEATGKSAMTIQRLLKIGEAA